jgi:hypothetical protein
MNDELRKQRAATVRARAEKADPFTKRGLLGLADSYERKVPSTAIPSISVDEKSNRAAN